MTTSIYIKKHVTNRLALLALLVGLNPFCALAQTEEAPQEKHTAKKKAALHTVENWLALIDANKYGRSWDAAAQIFKDNVPKSDWKKRIEAVRNPLGEVVSRKLIAQRYLTQMPGAPDGEYVIIQYATKFKNKQEALETIIPLVEDEKWKVSGYHVQ